MATRKEYIWMEKEQCPFCTARMTNGRLTRHVSRKHTDEQFHTFMEKERHKFDSLFELLKKIEAQ